VSRLSYLCFYNHLSRQCLAIEHNLAYLLGTCFYALKYSSAIEEQRLFLAASDALYTNNVSTRYNTKEYLF
jgi:hypothetical protein